jgi:predicted negative regulator of RcsB-dependent stress response
MTSGMIALVASVLVILGVLIGWRLSRWQFETQARRQAAAQLSVYRQLHELQAARRESHSASSNPGNPAYGFQRGAA